MKTQIEANSRFPGCENNNSILRAAGIKRIFPGWYSVTFNGVRLDESTVVSAKRNKKGEIHFKF